MKSRSGTKPGWRRLWVCGVFRCSFGPVGACGGTLAGKIIPKANRSLYSSLMFSGTLFGGFTGHMFSGVAIPLLSHDGSYIALSVVGFVWASAWVAMTWGAPYDRADDGSSHSMMLGTTPWARIFGTMPFIGLLFASLG